MIGWGILLAQGRGNLEMHKKMDLLSDRANLVTRALVPPIVVEPGDRRRKAPPRDGSWLTIRRSGLFAGRAELRCATLLIVGRHDPPNAPPGQRGAS
jgi:hypothetical protein